MKKRAFTLPELLVVLGVIAILIAILLPVARRVRESAHQTVCLSHLRLLAQATISYCGDNEGVFPGNGNGYSSNGGPWNPTAPAVPPSDWIYWDTNAPANNVTLSPLLKYLNANDTTVLICPSDNMARGLPYNTAHTGESTYSYSYSFNVFLGNGPDYHPTQTIKLGQVKNAPAIIMFIDEDERTVNDGAFLPVYNGGTIQDSIASHHDGDKTLDDPTARGNVVFVDGHGEFITRAVSRQQTSYQPLLPTLVNY